MNTTDNGKTCTGTPVIVQPTPSTKSSESKSTTLASTAATTQVSKSTANTTQSTTRSNVPVSKPSKKPSNATPNSTTSNIPVSKPTSEPTTTESSSSYNTTEGNVEFRKGKNYLLLPSKMSIWENLDRGHEYKPKAVRSVHMTKFKILPYRPAKLYKMFIIILANMNNIICLIKLVSS